MFRNRREKKLAAALGIFMACSFGFDTVDGLVFQPVRHARSQVQAAAAKNQELALDYQLVEHAQRNLNAVVNQSLPAEPRVAALLYQGWLLERVDDAGLDAVVTPGRAVVENGIGHRIPFTIQASANLRQIGRFLDDFYSTPILHRITYLTIDNGGNSASTDRKITVTLEALALAGAPSRDSLPEPEHRAGSQTLQNCFARRDPFRRMTVTTSRKPVIARQQPPVPAAKPRVDALETIRLVASIWQQGQREAWFFDTRTEEELIVRVGAELTVDDFSAHVTDIGSDSITLSSNAGKHTTRLGQTLRESLAGQAR